MRRLRTPAIGLALAISAVAAPVVAAPGIACAAEATGGPRAALVVGTGSQTLTYCVALDAESVSGIRLIQLAGSQFGLQYRLGFGGQAVCQLSGVGVTGGDCFGAYPDFWGYWHGDGDGGWTWANSGAASASIEDGGMDGWTWGSGDSGTTHAKPAAVTFDDVCEEAEPSPPPSSSPPPSPDPPPADDEGSRDGSGGEGASSESGTGTEAASPSPSQSVRPSVSADGGRKNDGRSPQATSTPDSAPSSGPVSGLAAGTRPPSGGPPAGALLALAAMTVLGAGGWLTLRRRRRAETRGGD